MTLFIIFSVLALIASVCVGFRVYMHEGSKYGYRNVNKVWVAISMSMSYICFSAIGSLVTNTYASYPFESLVVMTFLGIATVVFAVRTVRAMIIA